MNGDFNTPKASNGGGISNSFTNQRTLGISSDHSFKALSGQSSKASLEALKATNLNIQKGISLFHLVYD